MWKKRLKEREREGAEREKDRDRVRTCTRVGKWQSDEQNVKKTRTTKIEEIRLPTDIK